MVNRRSPLLQIGALRPFRYRSRKKQHGAISHLAIIADNAEVQLRLPQVFLASDKLVGVAAATRASVGDVQIWRGSSGWNTSAKLVRLLEVLADALRPWRASHQPILFLDAASCHFTADVLHAGERTDLWVIPIPARLSWLVQPLDTHGFGVYKTLLLDEGRRLVRVAEGCDVPRGAWLCARTSTAERYLSQHSWRHAFEHNGLVGYQNFFIAILGRIRCSC